MCKTPKLQLTQRYRRHHHLRSAQPQDLRRRGMHNDMSSRHSVRQGASEEPAEQPAALHDGMDWTYVAIYNYHLNSKV
jgi:hypothetical protein